MRARRVTALVSATMGLVLLGGCGGEDEPSAGTTPDTSAPAADEPTEDSPSEEPSLEVPTDLPSDLPTDLPTDLSGLGLDESCEAIYEALLQAATATEDLATDPGAAGDLFAEIGQTLRDAASGADDDSISSAAENLAQVYDDFGAAIESGDVPDITELTDASTELQEACS